MTTDKDYNVIEIPSGESLETFTIKRVGMSYKSSSGVLAETVQKYEAEIATLRAQLAEWTHVDNGLPPCDGKTVFVGVNFLGSFVCFSGILVTKKYGITCVYKKAEVMYSLRRWKQLDMPKEQL